MFEINNLISSLLPSFNLQQLNACIVYDAIISGFNPIIFPFLLLFRIFGFGINLPLFIDVLILCVSITIFYLFVRFLHWIEALLILLLPESTLLIRLVLGIVIGIISGIMIGTHFGGWWGIISFVIMFGLAFLSGLKIFKVIFFLLVITGPPLLIISSLLCNPSKIPQDGLQIFLEIQNLLKNFPSSSP